MHAFFTDCRRDKTRQPNAHRNQNHPFSHLDHIHCRFFCTVDYNKEVDKSTVRTKALQRIFVLTVILATFSSLIEEYVLPWLIKDQDTLDAAILIFQIAVPVVAVVSAMLQLLLGNSSFSRIENILKSGESRQEEQSNTLKWIESRQEEQSNLLKSIESRQEEQSNLLKSIDNSLKSMVETKADTAHTVQLSREMDGATFSDHVFVACSELSTTSLHDVAIEAITGYGDGRVWSTCNIPSGTVLWLKCSKGNIHFSCTLCGDKIKNTMIGSLMDTFSCAETPTALNIMVYDDEDIPDNFDPSELLAAMN